MDTPEVPFVMTMDADMILPPISLPWCSSACTGSRQCYVVLCRIADLPQHALLPRNYDALREAFARWHAVTRLRPSIGTGGI